MFRAAITGPNFAPNQRHRPGFQAHSGRAAAHLRDSVRALVHGRAAYGEGVALGRHSRRRDGHGRFALGALSARRRRARGPGGSAQAQARPEKAVAAGVGAGGAAQGFAAGRAGIDGRQPRGRTGVAVYLQAAAGQGALHAAPRADLLPLIIAVVFSAMVVQAITSFSLTQLLSKAGQRLIAEMRRQVQRHVGLLSVAYYDENRTGTLVARIMTDVEGVRNLVGTGLVEFVGGMLTAVLAFLYLLHLQRDGYADGLCRDRRIRFCSAVWLQGHSPHLPRAGQDQRRGYGAADGIAGRRAGDQGLPCRGARGEGFLRRRGPAAGQRDEVADHDQRPGRRIHHGAGDGFGAGDVAGRPSRAGKHLDGGRLLQLQHVSGLHDRAGLPDGEHRDAVDGGFCRPGPHQRDHGGAGRESGSGPHREDAANPGHGAL